MTEKISRKTVLKKALWELLKKYDVNKKIDYGKIVPDNHSKGELYHYLNDNWKDGKELKKDGERILSNSESLRLKVAEMNKDIEDLLKEEGDLRVKGNLEKSKELKVKIVQLQEESKKTQEKVNNLQIEGNKLLVEANWDDARDKKLCWEIMQEWARKDKVLEHISGPYWQRLK